MSPAVRTCLVLIAAVLLTGCAAGPEPGPAPYGSAEAVAAPSPAVVPTPPAVVPPGITPQAAAARPRAAARPAGLVIPDLGVRTGPLLPLGIEAGGALEVPPDAATAGWFTLSPAPGADGPAIIAAHVDYAGRPGVFARLAELREGAEVSVRRADGVEAVFTTYRVQRFAKSGFPSDDVYGDTAGPELRLITCGGAFDPGTGHYQDNVVAFARLTGTR